LIRAIFAGGIDSIRPEKASYCSDESKYSRFPAKKDVPLGIFCMCTAVAAQRKTREDRDGTAIPLDDFSAALGTR
jgi:hypothetical protein